MATMSRVTTKASGAASDLTGLLHRLFDPKKELKGHPVTLKECKFVVECAKKFYKKHGKPLIYVDAPITIIGDTHGQFRDVLRTFAQCGSPQSTSYLFLGDYVDRGSRGIENMILLFTLQVSYHKRMHLLRGNHEASEINGHYGFKTELITRFGEDNGIQLWKDFNEAFTWMPLAAVVSGRAKDEEKSPTGRLFCMHGGIPSKVISPEFDELKALKLPIISPRDNDLVAELLWSDPAEEATDFVKNPRGMGCQFGPRQANEFCQRHGVDMIVRAHQVFKEGFKYMGNNCMTIFGAPNYGGEFDNNAASLKVRADTAVLEIDCVEPYHVNRK